MNTYRHYFNIDPEYFPAVNPDVIEHSPNLWKKFYPHPTFVNLIKDTVAVLSRKQRLNIWVDGAYGTGKSHAVLTLEHLLEASEEDTKDYFYKYNLDQDLYKQFANVKSQGRILTVHRYGSSSINGDNDLFLLIQESITQAMKEVGIDNASGMPALKQAVLDYLSNEENKASFSIYVNNSYRNLFNGESVDSIIEHLSIYKGAALLELMGKIFRVGNERQIRVFSLSSRHLADWIKSVIDANHLKAIVFLWDEFTEYFNSNAHHLTGFQEVMELSQTTPFCFILVVHRDPKQIEGISNDDRKKIMDRVCKPVCTIELPDNIAFQLMGTAMQKSSDKLVKEEWDKEIIPDLCDRTTEARKVVSNFAKITDQELKDILPIHPYSAALLKQISSFFESNQRSMFDFIKNDRGDEIKGFQWFIDNYGPEDDDNPFLTVDMLWSFFYDMNKDGLSQDMRSVLDYYPRLERNGKMDKDEKAVLKAVLLFQAISKSTNDSVDIYKSNVKNLTLAFEGVDSLGNGKAVQCADKLVRDGILYKKKINNDEVYSVLTGSMDTTQIDKKKGEFERVSTTNLIDQGQLSSCLELSDKLRLRYKVAYTAQSDLDNKIRKQFEESEQSANHIYAIVTFARTSDESANITKKIKDHFVKHPESKLVFIDYSHNTLAEELFNEWVQDKATSAYYQGTDNDQAEEYADYATNILTEWRNEIKKRGCVLYDTTFSTGQNINDEEKLAEELLDIVYKRFTCCLEHYSVTDTMWKSSGLKQGVEMGVNEEVKYAYSSSNPTTKLENALDKAWHVEKYWEKSPSELISKIKAHVNDVVDKALESNGRIAISDIYNDLKQPPFGFLPCNLTAFILGFVMKEYVKRGDLTWSDDVQSTDLTVDKFKEMVDEVIKQDNTPNKRYQNKYIVAMTPEEKAFINTTSTGFKIDKQVCSSLESTRARIRYSMVNLMFPVWSLQYYITSDEGEKEIAQLTTPVEILLEAVDLFYNIANNNREKSGQSDNDIAIKIGKISLKAPKLGEDLKRIITSDHCRLGMEQYLSEYKEGKLLQLAEKIHDGGQYINAVKAKFDADQANWVWKIETANEKIDEVIEEYRVAAATTDWLGQTCKSYNEAVQKIKERCNTLRLPYVMVKNDLGDMNHLMNILYNLVKTGSLQKTELVSLQEDIELYGKDFNNFQAEQIKYFKKTCDTYLSDLNDNDINNVFTSVSVGSFTKDQPEYLQALEKIVTDYKQKQESVQMRKIWKENTGTVSPLDWSKQYLMPIRYMLNDEHYAEGSRVFEIINSHNPDNNSVNEALKFLENVPADFWKDLADAQKRDAIFRKKVLEDKAIMLSDIQEVKRYLFDHIAGEPYYWDQQSGVRKVIEDLARKAYCNGGYNAAFSKIDSMDAEAVKKYLKSLIKNNMNVGIEIIKDN